MTVMIIVAEMRTVGLLVIPGVSGVVCLRHKKLLGEMMHPMRRGSGEKKTKRRGDAQV